MTTGQGLRADYYAAVENILDAHGVDNPRLAADLVDAMTASTSGTLRAVADGLDEYGDRYYAAVTRQLAARIDP